MCSGNARGLASSRSVPHWHRLCLEFMVLSSDTSHRDALRAARDREAAHVEARLRLDGAKVLRLAHLAEELRQSKRVSPLVLEDVELKAALGDEPQLWLDLQHTVSMQPDSSTYRLNAYGTDKIDLLLETESLIKISGACERVLVQADVRRLWQESGKRNADSHYSFTTLLYVWGTGFVAGGALLALLSIYLKKIPF
jgi:hypothetical protein